MRNLLRKPACWVFLILLGSYAFFWHSRDWNTASRLMLTYSWSTAARSSSPGWIDKPATRPGSRASIIPTSCPAFPCSATVPYRSPKLVFGFPRHPLGEPAGPPVLGGRLLGHAVHFRSADGRHRRASGVLVAVPGLPAGPGCLARPRLRPGDAGLRLCHARLRPPGDGVRSFRVVLPALEEGPPATAGSRVLAGFLAAYAAVIELQSGRCRRSWAFTFWSSASPAGVGLTTWRSSESGR